MSTTLESPPPVTLARDSRRIHLTKMVTWRVLATTTTFAIVYALTGDVRAGAAVGGLEVIAKMALYYGHERAWSALLSR